ncbi:hypothetical protein L596_001671 [Steinernema carpocapsae]|uniref:protein-tyrosine-phosphatase n=1 Tax=Steinernema carpocapsae TaxID=34508 RepID=A0A4U8UMF3_STECR|nr:hypothetical protein L596_001671 [Steinernema carpocapsae]
MVREQRSGMVQTEHQYRLNRPGLPRRGESVPRRALPWNWPHCGPLQCWHRQNRNFHRDRHPDQPDQEDRLQLPNRHLQHVKMVREQRSGMVQTEHQYRFL